MEGLRQGLAAGCSSGSRGLKRNGYAPAVPMERDGPLYWQGARRWSPQQIAGRLARGGSPGAQPRSIYRFVYRRSAGPTGGLAASPRARPETGLAGSGAQRAPRFIPHLWHPYRRYDRWRWLRGRPLAHWEADLMRFGRSGPVVLALHSERREQGADVEGPFPRRGARPSPSTTGATASTPWASPSATPIPPGWRTPRPPAAAAPQDPATRIIQLYNNTPRSASATARLPRPLTIRGASRERRGAGALHGLRVSGPHCPAPLDTGFRRYDGGGWGNDARPRRPRARPCPGFPRSRETTRRGPLGWGWRRRFASG